MAGWRSNRRPKRKATDASPSGKPIAKVDGIVVEELLPYPIVHYPDHYGIFLAFQKDARAPLTLCACSRAAVSNHLRAELMEIDYNYLDEGERTDGFRTYRKGQVGVGRDFPVAVRQLFGDRGHTPQAILKTLKSAPNLCHECNGATPSVLYCHDIYGSSFKQNFGWYQSKLALEYGIQDNKVYFPDLCPPEILSLVSVPYVVDGAISPDYHRHAYGRQTRSERDAIERAIEDIVRQRYGHKRIGDAWTNETILYRIVCGLFPGQDVRRHHRPKFLEGLELDIFVPAFNLGLEYQGIQHYEPVEHWGGADSLARLQQRDARKKTLCHQHGITLIYFDYTEGLSDKYVASKLRPFLP